MKVLTDQNFNYRESPIQYDGVGQIDSIKGNTLVWNQLVNTLGGAVSKDGLTVTKDTSDLSFTFTGTASTTTAFSITAAVLKHAHKYLFMGGHGDVSGVTLYDGYTGHGDAQLSGGIITVPSENMNLSMYAKFVQGTQVNNLKIRPQIIDLTQMFGSGNEPSTVEEFTSLYPLPYYSYEQGKLLPFSGEGIKTVGFNQWDEETRNGYYNSSTGAFVSQASTVANTNPIKVFGGEKYYVYVSTTKNLSVYYYDSSMNYIRQGYHVQNSEITLPTNCAYMNLSTDYGSGATIGANVCINISSSENGKYEPYTSSTTSIPTSTYFPNGMMGWGTAFDEMTNTKAIHRMNQVDLGTLPWNMSGSGATAFFYADTTSLHVAPTISAVGYQNYVCPKYSIVNVSSSATDTGIGFASATQLRVRDTTYQSASDFATAMNGVMLQFELAEEVVVDINPPLNLLYDTYAGGTEEILPVNTDVPSTTQFLGDITYFSQVESLVPYRVFWLVNANGARWDFTKHDFKVFLNEPQGLGFQKTIDITRYGERAVKNSETYNFPTVSGDLLFYDDANSTRYDKYNELVRFLMDQPITLYYQIPVSVYSRIANIYTLDCEVTSLTKTESKSDGVMTCNISLSGMGFYIGEEVTISGSGSVYTVNNTGDLPVGFEITVEGSMLNPYFIVSQDDVAYGEAKFDDSAAFNSVYVNSNGGEQSVTLEQGGAVLPNPMGYRDLSISNGSIYVTFVKLERGVSKIEIGGEEGTSISSVRIVFSPIFRSV